MDAPHPPGTEPDRPRRRGKRLPWVLISIGIVLVLAVAGWQLYATLWTAHSNSVGRSLVHRFLQNHSLHAPLSLPKAETGTTSNGDATSVGATGSAAAGTATLAACKSASAASTSTPVHGLLEIPKLGVVAPVVQGLGNDQLAYAVGHDPYSVWPGTDGNAVLAAHDVSYFTAIDQLDPGARVRYVTPCTTYDFRVTSHAIVRAGSPVYETATPTVTLVTCWPTNALWFTPDRYLVTAALVSSHATGSGSSYVTVSTPPTVPVPSPLVAQGVTLVTYSLPMGTFTLNGTPDAAWSQTTSPLLAEGSGVKAFIAGVRALTENHLDWWDQVAPGVTAPPPLVGAQNPSYLSPTDVVVTASGTKVTAVTLTDTVSVSGGSAPGRYTMLVHEVVHGHTLVISSWTMTPA